MPEVLSLAVVLFDQVFALDFQGPLALFSILAPDPEIAKLLPHTPAYNIAASYLAVSADPVHAAGGPQLVPTRTYASVKPGEQFDIILIPGGLGTLPGVTNEAVIEFIKAQAPGAKYVLSVCTGSELLARAGVLAGKRATTNKASFVRIRDEHPTVEWVAKARWVVDGKLWTSSGVTAGADMGYAFTEFLVGHEIANTGRGVIELSKREQDDDEFAEFYKLV
ncbi:hypothetical protein PHLGIDRAFT_120629 [Phlebiopsis gigantea 11061_1 CR5-6]|uniref:DJ-1/PfpI domain-containing protein n=1 Tax=Phlebiopsis gigantea (strain 11061_1 CR5-6) TaxID=745531 RepID=A0A0C3S3N9_PHLG1|nr:hypothetical protein PHLGIDRAFT_120629 [Phlebiopsis gigantea 11061_1 CR5-6]